MIAQNKLSVVVIEPGYSHYDTEHEILKAYVPEIIIIAEDAPDDEKMTKLRGANAVLVREAVVDSELIEHMATCQVIVRYGVGVDNIDLEAAKAKRIYVANVPQYGAVHEVSCHAVALVLAVSRLIIKRDQAVRNGEWGIGDAEPIYSFRGKGLGIIGFGSIARSFLEKMRPFGFKDIWIYHPRLSSEDIEKVGGTKATIETVCRNSDVISLHAPLTEETHHIIGADQLAMMNKRTILINTGRGALVDEQALVRALKEGRIRGAGIDVFEKEPPDENNSLFALDNVILSDHTAWYSDQTLQELQAKAAQEIHRVFSGKKPASWLNPW